MAADRGGLRQVEAATAQEEEEGIDSDRKVDITEGSGSGGQQQKS